jgi:hypothetical protein
LRGWTMFGGGEPKSAAPEVSAFGERVPKVVVEEGEEEASKADAPSSPIDEKARTPSTKEKDPYAHLPSSPIAAGATLVRKFGSMLTGDGTHGRKQHTKRGTILDGLVGSPRPSKDLGDRTPVSPVDKENVDEKAGSQAQTPTAASGQDSDKPAPSVTISPDADKKPNKSVSMQPIGSVHRRAATILDPSGRAQRHERRSSTGGQLLSGLTSHGTIGRHRRPSTGHGTLSRPLADRLFSRTEEVDEGAEEAARADAEGEPTTAGEDTDKEGEGDKDFKPVFLKGLFSVTNTSTKPPATIKADIRRVLDRMQVQYTENKTGFECIHLPSIDMNSIMAPSPRNGSGAHGQHPSDGSSGGTYRRTITKKASKLSGLRIGRGGEKGKDREPSIDTVNTTGRPSTGPSLVTSPSGSSSFFNVSTNTHNTVVPSEGHGHEGQGQPGTQSGEYLNGLTTPGPDESGSMTVRRSPSTKSKVLPPIPRDFGGKSPIPTTPSVTAMPSGKVDKDVFESMGNNRLSVRFEINIIKVPWLPLHGIQFRRSGGDGWQYHMLARRVLTELKL